MYVFNIHDIEKTSGAENATRNRAYLGIRRSLGVFSAAQATTRSYVQLLGRVKERRFWLRAVVGNPGSLVLLSLDRQIQAWAGDLAIPLEQLRLVMLKIGAAEGVDSSNDFNQKTYQFHASSECADPARVKHRKTYNRCSYG